jgi:uncharacterized protein (TIGR00251 family)
MIAISNHPEGCILPVRAQPGARKSGIIGEHAGALKIAVNAPPEAGRANRALIELLAEILGIKRSRLELARGEASREKQFLVRGLSPADLRATLEKILDE